MRIGITGWIAVAVWGWVGLSTPLWAGEYNTVLNIGDVAPDWKDLPGIDSKKHSLADLKETPIVVVAFICNSCDVSTDYEDRLIAFSKKYAEKVAVVAINVNTIPADRMPKMQERAKQKMYTFPYLYDETQKIAKDYGATFTPELFVLNKDRKIVYMGGMDDNSSPELVKKQFLESAIEATLQGKPVETAETVAIGCRIRYVSDRKKKKD